MATQASSHKSVDVGSALSTLVRMLGGHQYVQQWSMDILARVVQLKDRASNEQRRDIKETTSQLVRRLDQVINNLVTRPVGELHSEDLFFSGSIPPFEQLTAGLFWIHATLPRSSIFRRITFRYIVERASQTINVEDSLVPDHGSLLLKTSNDINGIAALSPWCEYACRSLTELVCDNQGDSWSQAIAADQREAVSKIIGITRLVLVRVVASRQIEAAYYNLWIPTPKWILDELKAPSQPVHQWHLPELPKLADRHRDSPGSLQGPSSSYLDPSERHRSPSTVSQRPPTRPFDAQHSLSHSHDLVSRRKQALYRF